jgi:hypothetical protein
MAMEVPAAATSDNTLPPQWEELYDEAEGKPYFYNNDTDESLWERPTE